jgi:hypothetical protein
MVGGRAVFILARGEPFVAQNSPDVLIVPQSNFKGITCVFDGSDSTQVPSERLSLNI